MALREELERTGGWLFRWRSFLPLALLVPLLIELRAEGTPTGRPHVLWEVCCMAVSLGGLAVRIATVGHAPARTSGRNTHSQKADVLNVTGMYSVVRHPLYLGNFLMWLGIALLTMKWRFVVIFALAFWVYYERIMIAEEGFLRSKFGDAFSEWAASTPAFIPRITQWQPPSLPFCLKTVLKREYTGFFAIAIGFNAVKLVQQANAGRIDLEPHFSILGCMGLFAYAVLRTAKKTSALLKVEGR